MDVTRRRCFQSGNKENAAPPFSRGQCAPQPHQDTNPKSRAPTVRPKPPGGGAGGALRKGGPAPGPRALLSHNPPGMYRGRVVQSKVACVWKRSSPGEGAGAPAPPPQGSSCPGGALLPPQPARQARVAMATGGGPRSKTSDPGAQGLQGALSLDQDLDQEGCRSKVTAGAVQQPQEPVEAQDAVLPAAPGRLQGGALKPHNPPTGPPPNPGLSDPPALEEAAVPTPPLAEAVGPSVGDEPRPALGPRPPPQDGARPGWRRHPGGRMAAAPPGKTKDTGTEQTVPRPKELGGRDQRVGGPLAPQEPSTVKYSVSTTPYLQSVKQRLEEARSGGRSIKDLRFLTPVRRSCRIQRCSQQLPAMLQDHDPCVETLAELGRLEDSPHAFIYRSNPALSQYMGHGSCP